MTSFVPPSSRVATLVVLVVALAFTSVGILGCANTRAEKGAVVGAGTGAVVGGIIGKATGKTTRGVLIGAAVGGAAGAIIGRQMDKQAAELEQDLDNAEVERVAEGIQVTFDSGLLFDFDSASLRPTAQDNLRDLANSLDDYPNTELLVTGHTDSVGSEDYNQRLSERRALAAAQYLTEQGIAPGRIETTGYGESMPVATNETEAGRQQNRRVEIAIYASEEYREALAEQNN